MFIPMKPRYSKEYFARKMSGLSDALLKAECRADDFPNEEHRYYLRMMSSLATDSVGMSFRLEHLLAPYVTFLIMPIFAFANAGVSIDSLEYFRIFTLRRRPVRSARASSSDCSWASRSVFSWPVGSP